jgi:hypothetical protein
VLERAGERKRSIGESMVGMEKRLKTWTELPVWKAHHTKTAEKEIESLKKRLEREREIGKGRMADMKPVMKQKAVSGTVD